MYVLHTVGSFYSNEPLLTFSSHEDAWIASRALRGGWFDIEQIF